MSDQKICCVKCDSEEAILDHLENGPLCLDCFDSLCDICKEKEGEYEGGYLSLFVICGECKEENDRK